MARAGARGIRRVLHASPARTDALSVLAPLADLIICSPDALCAITRMNGGPEWQEGMDEGHIHALPDARLHQLCRCVSGDLVVLLGARGAFLSTREGQFRLLGDVRAPTTLHGLRCADEAFVGALCAALDTEGELNAAVRIAVTASATLPRPGGQEALLRKADIQAAIQ